MFHLRRARHHVRHGVVGLLHGVHGPVQRARAGLLLQRRRADEAVPRHRRVQLRPPAHPVLRGGCCSHSYHFHRRGVHVRDEVDEGSAPGPGENHRDRRLLLPQPPCPSHHTLHRCVCIRPVRDGHLRQRGPGGDGGSLALLPVRLQAQLHRHRVSLQSPVYCQRQHLHGEPHHRGERAPVVPFQGRFAQCLLGCLSDDVHHQHHQDQVQPPGQARALSGHALFSLPHRPQPSLGVPKPLLGRGGWIHTGISGCSLSGRVCCEQLQRRPQCSSQAENRRLPRTASDDFPTCREPSGDSQRTEPLGVDDGGHMTKGAAPGHVCVSTALPDTMTRTHATWLRLLNKKTLLIYLFDSPRGQNTTCF